MRTVFLAVLASLGVLLGTSAASAQNFYCADANMLDASVLANPNFRKSLPKPRALLPMEYQYYFHDGEFGFEYADETRIFNGVRAQPAQGPVRVYADTRGNRWTVTSLGGGKLQIQGTATEGKLSAVACNMPGAAVAPAAQVVRAPARPAATAQAVPASAAKANKYICNKGMRFTIVAGWVNYDYPDQIIIEIPGEKPQTLTRSRDDRSTWRNANWEFYEFKNFHNLSDLRNRSRYYDCGPA